MLAQHSSIPENYHAVFRPCQRNVESTRIVQESDTRSLIRPNAWEQDKVFLSTLEAVYRCYLYLSIELSFKLALSLHVREYESSLTFVGSDNANLVGSESCVEHGSDYLLYVLGFNSVQVGCTACWYLFIRNTVVEHHRFVRLRPGELESLEDSVLFWDSILETSFIESHWGEIRQTRVHPVLDLKADGPDAQANKTLEKALIHSSFCSLFAHNHRAKLAMITHQYYMLCTLEDGNQCFRLSSLCSFINKHLSEFQVA